MIDYEEDSFLQILTQRQGSVMPKAALYAMPSMILAALLIYLDEWYPNMRDDLGMHEVNKSQLWAATTGVLTFMMSFRTSQAWGRFWEGTGLLHQMRGEWFDTVSNCVSFSIAAKDGKMEKVTTFRHTIIRLMSLCHGSALEEIAGGQIEMESIDVFGLSDGTLAHLQDCHCKYHFNKVEVMLHLLQSLITRALDEGVLRIPPPILSRVYQTISRGFVNLLNAKKIQDTKFPFPYAQLITFLLVSLEFLTPLMMSTVIHSKVLCVIFTFIPMFGLFCLNFVAQELEDPFGIDCNDLPLGRFQTEMNNCLMMLLHPNADVMADIGPRCELDFHKLYNQITTHDEEESEDSDCPTQSSSMLNKLRRKFGTGTTRDSNADGRKSVASSASKATRLSHFDNTNYRGSWQRFTSATNPGRPPRDSSGSTMQKRDTIHSTTSLQTSQTARSSVLSDEILGDVGTDGVAISPTGTTATIGRFSSIESTELEGNCVTSETLGSRERGLKDEHPTHITPRKQELKLVREPPSGSCTTEDSDLEHNYNMHRMADLQPVLAKSMEELAGNLQAWTTNVHSDIDHIVDSLHQNSVVLQNALQKFAGGLPTNGEAGAHGHGEARRQTRERSRDSDGIGPKTYI